MKELSTKQPAREQETSHMESETIHKKSSSEINRIENTPFLLVKMNDKYFLAIGNSRLTEEYDDKEVLMKEIEEKSWDLILRTAIFVVERNEQLKK